MIDNHISLSTYYNNIKTEVISCKKKQQGYFVSCVRLLDGSSVLHRSYIPCFYILSFYWNMVSKNHNAHLCCDYSWGKTNKMWCDKVRMKASNMLLRDKTRVNRTGFLTRILPNQLAWSFRSKPKTHEILSPSIKLASIEEGKKQKE